MITEEYMIMMLWDSLVAGAGKHPSSQLSLTWKLEKDSVKPGILRIHSV